MNYQETLNITNSEIVNPEISLIDTFIKMTNLLMYIQGYSKNDQDLSRKVRSYRDQHNQGNFSEHRYVCSEIVNLVEDPSLREQLAKMWITYLESIQNFRTIFELLVSPRIGEINLGSYQTSEYIGNLYAKVLEKYRTPDVEEDQSHSFAEPFFIASKLMQLEKKGELKSKLFKNEPESRLDRPAPRDLQDRAKYLTGWKERYALLLHLEINRMIEQIKFEIAREEAKKGRWGADQGVYNVRVSEEEAQEKTYNALAREAKWLLDATNLLEDRISQLTKEGNAYISNTVNPLYVELYNTFKKYSELVGKSTYFDAVTIRSRRDAENDKKGNMIFSRMRRIFRL